MFCTCPKVPRACKCEGSRVFMADVVRRHSLRNTQEVQRELSFMALVLASRSKYFWKSEQFHFILAINVLFRDLDLNSAAPGEIPIYLLAAYVACRETKLEGCADSIKTIAQHVLQTWPIHFCFDDTASPPLRFEHRFRPVQAKGFGAAGHSACVATSQQHYGTAALVLNVAIATRTHGHGHVSTHVRWLYNPIRVANAAAVFDGFFFGPINKSCFASGGGASWLGGFLVTCSWRSGPIAERDERTHSSRRTYHLVSSPG